MMNAILDKYDVDFLIVSSNKLNLTECRIDPQFFSLNQSFIDGLETKPLSEFCIDIFNPPVFKREFLEDKNECRYLASAEIVSLEPELTYITNTQADNLQLRVKKNWVLVTGFGTVGSIRIVDNIINGFAVANNVARIVTKKGYEGFIAAYLSSIYGNKLLNDYAAGAVVKYIEAPQISKIPVPVLNETTIQEINARYLNSVSCREKANLLLEEAQRLLYKFNNLPALSTENIETLDPQKESEIRLTNISEFTPSYRLDAHFYNPIAKKAIENIQYHSINFRKLKDDITDKVFYLNRFTRTFVEESFGIPYMAGKDIIKIRPSDVAYLSSTETSGLTDYKLNTGWILMTCSGTLARTCFIYKNYEDWVGTHDLIRIVSKQDFDSGYLYAFLSSDYGYYQALRYKHGAVIDHLTPDQVEEILIPLPSVTQQKQIGDLVRQAYDLRSEAIRLENEAQTLLTQALTK